MRRRRPSGRPALVDRVLGRLSREVTDRAGRIDEYIGDNVMAVFGAPVAHEDDPERAVMAGLAMQDAMSEINAEVGARAASRDVELALRVGINSGEVLAGRLGDQYTVIGDTVNVAARLQAASGLGAVTVGAATRRLTAAAIEYRELEPLTLKGKSRPIAAWEAIGAVDPAARLQSGRGVAPLIGRHEELALLASLFDRGVRESRPYLVTVFSEAGVGKSRLLNELTTELQRRADPVDVLVGRSPAYGTTTAYAALAEVLSDHRVEASASAAQLVRLLGSTNATKPRTQPPATTPSRSAIGSSPPSAGCSSNSAQGRRSSWRSRTSVGRTRECSTSSSTWPQADAVRF